MKILFKLLAILCWSIPFPPSICRCHTAASITSKVGDFDQTSSSSECALLLASNSSQFGANIWSNVANLNVKTALKPTWWPHDLRFVLKRRSAESTTRYVLWVFWKVVIEYPNKSNHKTEVWKEICWKKKSIQIEMKYVITEKETLRIQNVFEHHFNLEDIFCCDFCLLLKNNFKTRPRNTFKPLI